jgi:hypothetical protein
MSFLEMFFWFTVMYTVGSLAVFFRLSSLAILDSSDYLSELLPAFTSYGISCLLSVLVFNGSIFLWPELAIDLALPAFMAVTCIIMVLHVRSAYTSWRADELTELRETLLGGSYFAVMTLLSIIGFLVLNV